MLPGEKGYEMNRISVIIPALNEEKHISNVIKIVKNCNLIDEIIVVDNNKKFFLIVILIIFYAFFIKNIALTKFCFY